MCTSALMLWAPQECMTSHVECRQRLYIVIYSIAYQESRSCTGTAWLQWSLWTRVRIPLASYFFQFFTGFILSQSHILFHFSSTMPYSEKFTGFLFHECRTPCTQYWFLTYGRRHVPLTLTCCIPVFNQVSAERPEEIKTLVVEKLCLVRSGHIRRIDNTFGVALPSPKYIIVH